MLYDTLQGELILVAVAQMMLMRGNDRHPAYVITQYLV